MLGKHRLLTVSFSFLSGALGAAIYILAHNSLIYPDEKTDQHVKGVSGVEYKDKGKQMRRGQITRCLRNRVLSFYKVWDSIHCSCSFSFFRTSLPIGIFRNLHLCLSGGLMNAYGTTLISRCKVQK